jgi:hypothetical protein
MGRSIDLSQFPRLPIYAFIGLTGRSIHEPEAAAVESSSPASIIEGWICQLGMPPSSAKRCLANLDRGLARCGREMTMLRWQAVIVFLPRGMIFFPISAACARVALV